MLASVKKGGLKIKNSITETTNAIYRWLRRHRKAIIITISIILAIALVVTLVMVAYRGIGITVQANIINHTEQRILDETYINQVQLIGLNSQYFEVPRRKFIIYFQEEPTYSEEYWSPKIIARSLQGTKLIVSARVSCQVIVPSLKNFLEQYGLNWRIYAIQKTKNVVIQKIAGIKFYDLNNSLIIDQVNTQFQTYKSSLSNYPFTFKLIGLKIQYPEGSFSYNSSLGVGLLRQKSLLSQLTTNYQLLNNKTTLNYSLISALGANIGQLQSEVRIIQMQPYNLDPHWLAGLASLKSALGNNNDQLRQFLWVYFQKIYNSTYNNYSIY